MRNRKKDYQKLVSILDKAAAFLQPREDAEDVQVVKAAFKEIQDILYDYPQQAEQLRLLMEKYETEVPVTIRGIDFYQCPACNGRTGRRHSHCHKCGKKLGWGGRIKKGRRIGQQKK